jgi:ABC-type glycerol-3-phosphate transport system permease component
MNWGVTLALAIIVFIGAWNAFLWPFLAVTKPEQMNVTVSIAQLRQYGFSRSISGRGNSYDTVIRTVLARQV